MFPFGFSAPYVRGQLFNSAVAHFHLPGPREHLGSWPDVELSPPRESGTGEGNRLVGRNLFGGKGGNEVQPGIESPQTRAGGSQDFRECQVTLPIVLAERLPSKP